MGRFGRDLVLRSPTRSGLINDILYTNENVLQRSLRSLFGRPRVAYIVTRASYVSARLRKAAGIAAHLPCMLVEGSGEYAPRYRALERCVARERRVSRRSAF